MTILMQKPAISATATPSNFGFSSPPEHMLSLSAAHDRSIAVLPSGAHWMTGGNFGTLPPKLSDLDVWLRRAALEPAVRSVKDVWTGIGSNIVPSKIMDFTVSTDDLYPNLREVLQDLDATEDEAHEEGFPVFSPSVLPSAHRLLRAFDAGGAGSSTMQPKIVDFTASTDDLYPNLREALQDLDAAEGEAREEGFPIPSDTALGNARRLLRAMYRILPRRFEVYPMPDGEIAIDVPGGCGHSVILLCEPAGGALCLVNMNGRHRRARYDDTHDLPDGFVCEALKDLERRETSAA